MGGIRSMSVKAYGTFKKVGEYIFRTDAYLQWGSSSESIGTIILFNPGSSRLIDDIPWGLFKKNKQSNIELTGELVLDPTMEVIRDIINDVHPHISGRLQICNLMNLREAKMNNAITIYEKIKDQDVFKDVLHTDYSFLSKQETPWVWCAWSVESKKSINMRKKEVADNLRKLEIKRYAVYRPEDDDTSIHTYHVRPQLKEKQKEYANKIIIEMRG
jgi:hypothetical protein